MTVKRHVRKGRSQANPEGGIVEKAGTVAISNVMVVAGGEGGPPARRWRASSAPRRRPASPGARRARRQSNASPGNPAGAGRRPGETTMAARLKERYEKEVRPALMKEFGYKNPMQVPRLEKIVVNMGLGEAINNAKIIDAVGGAAGRHHRPEAGRHQGAEVDRELQAAPGPEHRRDGDAARRPHVRVPRPPGHRRAAARPRLQGRVAQGLRRQGQLHARHPRADHLPRDQLRQGREDQGAEHHHRDDGPRRRGGRALLRFLGMPFRT